MKTVATVSAPSSASSASSASASQGLRPQGCTNLKLRQLMRRVAQHYDTEMAKAGLKTTQYSLLTCLDKLGPMRPADLALQLMVDASTLTRNLQPIVRAGWAVQTAGADGRSRSIALTPEGRAKRQLGQRHWKAAQLALNQTLGAERVLALHGLVDDALALLASEVA
jgi:DNA-binding MarR family transcriptional regulator